MAGVAEAGRKRVVVLAFVGPQAEQFHDDLERLIKKTHTVVPIEKWNTTAQELGADSRSEADFKKVAKKLKIDAIVQGRIEKRRDEFIIRIKLLQGKTGAAAGRTIATQSAVPQLDARSQRDLKDELLGALEGVELNRVAGAAEDEEDKPARSGFSKRSFDEDRGVTPRPAPAADDEGDEPPPPRQVTRPAEDEPRPRGKRGKPPEDEEPPPRQVARQAEEEDEARRLRNKRGKPSDEGDRGQLPGDDDRGQRQDDDARAKPRKAVAARDDDTTELDADAEPPLTTEAATSPAERAIDAVAGLSVTARTLSFQTRPDFDAPPPEYDGKPVGGLMLDVTVYPLAFGHKRRDIAKNFGLNFMYDRVAKIASRDPMDRVLETTEWRVGFAGVFRYPIGRGANPPVVGGTLGYASQTFEITGAVDLPSVRYSIVAPGVFGRLPLGSNVVLGLDARLMLINDTGELQDQMHYGTTDVIGYEGAVSLDYQFWRNLFIRAALRYETIRFTFQGDGELTAGRDNDPTTADVKTGRDNYAGGFITLGVAY